MGTNSERRQTLLFALEAFQAEAHHLTRWPDLTFPQVFNEIYHNHSDSPDVRAWLESSAREFKRPWVRREVKDTSRSPHLKLTLAGHEKTVLCCRFSPCSRYLASVSTDRSLRIWEVSSGREIACMESDGIGLVGCCWSPDGERLATAGGSFLRVWDWKNQRQILAIDAGDNAVTQCCAWSPDERGILCAQGKENLALWEATTGSELWSISPEIRSGLACCAVSPDGRFMGMIFDSCMSFCDYSSSHRPRLLFQKNLGVRSQAGCSFSRDGRLFAYAWADGVEVLNTGDGSLRQIDNSFATSCCLSPDGKNLVVAGGHYGFAMIRVYDVESGRWVGELNGHQDVVNSIDWSQDGRLIASASRDAAVKVWDASVPWSLGESRNHSSGVIALSWHPDGSRVLSASRDGRAHIWASETGLWNSTVELRNRPSGPELNGCDYSPDGSAFVLSDDKGALEVFDSQTQASIWKVQDDEKQTRYCAWSPVGDRIASCGTQGAKIRDARSGHLLYILDGTEEATRLCFSPDGRSLATHSRSSVLVFDVETGSRLSEMAEFNRAIYWGQTRNEMSWSLDGSLLMVGDRDFTVAVIDPVAPRAIGRLSGHKGFKLGSAYFGSFGEAAEVLCAFISQRRFAVTAYVDGLVKLWDVFEGRLLAQLATDAAFWSLTARGERLCLGDDQGYLHWFSIESLPHEVGAPTLRPDVCDRCGDLMEQQSQTWRMVWLCSRCFQIREVE